MAAILDGIPFHERTIPNLIRRAGARGPRPFLSAPGGTLRHGDLPDAVARSAAAIRAAAIGATAIGATGPLGDAPVAVLMSNRVEFPLAWWGTIWAGGVAALMHAEFRGMLLEHAFKLLTPSVLIAEDVLLGHVAEIAASLPALRTVLVVGDAGDGFPRWPGPRFLRWNDARASVAACDPAPVEVSDDATIMFTSGTTGPSKGVRKSHHYDFIYGALAAEGIGLDESSNIWSCSPCSHARTTNCVLLGAMVSGARATLTSRFSASRFWTELREAGATHTYVSNWMANVLMKQPPAAEDRGHGVRVIHCLPPPVDPLAFQERFGVRLTGQGYGSTESYPLPQQLREQDWTRPRGFIGKPHPTMEVRIADRHGYPVPADGRTAGEMLVRPRLPYAMLSGYYRNPEATAEAFRDGWFHTGDGATIDADGNLGFTGRLSDSIRRRGENISAWEIEQAAIVLPGVAEVAAYGVPDELGEEEVKLDIVPDPGIALDPAALIARLDARLPRFMVPRYVELRQSLPKNPNGRIEKYVLRQQPLGPGVFDRTAHDRAAHDQAAGR